MERYKIVFKSSVKKDLKLISAKQVKSILKKIESLAVDPRQVGSKKLTSREEYRIRHGNYRILYEIRDSEIIVVVVKIAHRSKVYK